MPKLIALCVVLLVALPGRAWGQDVVYTAQQVEEVKAWLAKDFEWREWYGRWGRRTRADNEMCMHCDRPKPPKWLAAECAGVIDGAGTIMNGCELLRAITLGTDQSMLPPVESLDRTRFWEHFHVGGGWPLVMGNNSGNPFKCGAMFEAHFSVPVPGTRRLEINLPGFAFLALPGENGCSTMKVAGDVGMSMKLGMVKLPFGKRATTYLNIANAFPQQTAGRALTFKGRVSIIGVSFAPKF